MPSKSYNVKVTQLHYDHKVSHQSWVIYVEVKNPSCNKSAPCPTFLDFKSRANIADVLDLNTTLLISTSELGVKWSALEKKQKYNRKAQKFGQRKYSIRM